MGAWKGSCTVQVAEALYLLQELGGGKGGQKRMLQKKTLKAIGSGCSAALEGTSAFLNTESGRAVGVFGDKGWPRRVAEEY